MSKPRTKTAPPLQIISLGAGVQSTTMALMAAHGEITPMPDCAIFADTGAEPGAVYEHLKWLTSDNVLPFPVHIVRKGNILDGIEGMTSGNRWASIPAYVAGKGGSAAPIRRQCTTEYKIEPIVKKVRDLVGLNAGQRGPKHTAVMQWIGISLDEFQRAKPSNIGWIDHRFPLIDAGMHRWDCLQWMRKNGYPEPPKSACTFCPYHDNSMWRDLRDNHHKDWAEAVRVDALIADGTPDTDDGAGKRPMFLHRSLKRLPDVDLSTEEERGQGWLFGDECEGICGV